MSSGEEKALFVAAIDLGTNSCRLLVQEITDKSKRTTVYKDTVITRIGQRLQQTGQIAEKPLQDTLACLKHFQAVMQSYGVSKYRIVGTNALREAENSRELIAEARDALGLNIEIISGEEEAWLSYKGVRDKMPYLTAPLVIDLGGGSTEFIYNTESVALLKSIPWGAVKATEKALSFAEMLSLLGELAPWRSLLAGVTTVFCGGTATTLAAVSLKLEQYDPDLINGYLLFYDDIGRIYKQLNQMPLEQRKQVTGLQPQRADIICQGILFIMAIMHYLEQERIIVSDADLLEGIISSLI